VSYHVREQSLLQQKTDILVHAHYLRWHKGDIVFYLSCYHGILRRAHGFLSRANVCIVPQMFNQLPFLYNPFARVMMLLQTGSKISFVFTRSVCHLTP